MEEYELVKKESKHLSKFLIYISQSKDQLPSFLMILNEQFIYILKVIIGSDSHIPPIWHSCSEFKNKKQKTQRISSISYHSKQNESQVLSAAICCQNTSGDFFFFFFNRLKLLLFYHPKHCFPQIFKNVDFQKRPFVQWRQSGKVRENKKLLRAKTEPREASL